MIEIPLNSITIGDIERLVQEKRPEGKTLDYKRASYGRGTLTRILYDRGDISRTNALYPWQSPDERVNFQLEALLCGILRCGLGVV